MKAKRNKRPYPGGFQASPGKAQAMASLQRLSTPALAALLDTAVAVLRGRGVTVQDWDEKGRTIQRVTCIGGRVFILAPRGRQGPEETRHGESGENTGGGAPGA